MVKKITNVYNRISDNSAVLYVFGMLFLTYIVLMSKAGFGSDVWCWGQWAKYIFSNGLGNAYKSGTDYMPLYQYILFLFGKFQGNIENIDRNIHYLKIITLAFDFLAGFYLIKLLRMRFDKNLSIFYSSFFFLNIGYFYNTLVWNQVDGIMACFIFLAFYYAIKEKILVSLVFTFLSINFKLQAVIFIPLLGLLLLPLMIKQFSMRKMFAWMLTVVLLQILIIMPFLIAGDISKMWSVIKDSMGKYPVVSMNAYNFWYWVFRGNLREIQDSITFLGIACRSWGLLMFFGTSFLALYLLLRRVIYRLFYKENQGLVMDQLLIIASLIPLLFFFFNTEMHERYLHPALLFLAVYAILSKKYFPYIVASIAYFMNLERVLRFLQFNNYDTFIFHPSFVAFLFFICIVYLFYQLYKAHSAKNTLV
jgi:Gpi18-like mannosyltransferase